jgi:hypothetical protein
MHTTDQPSKTLGLTAQEILGPTPLLEIENEPPARLIVDPPLSQQLAEGRVYIQYRTENIRIMPAFGHGALGVSPRIGHLHITVDDAPWHYVDASGGTIVIVGLEPGQHSVMIELADPIHRVIAIETVRFTLATRREPMPKLKSWNRKPGCS